MTVLPLDLQFLHTHPHPFPLAHCVRMINRLNSPRLPPLPEFQHTTAISHWNCSSNLPSATANLSGNQKNETDYSQRIGTNTQFAVKINKPDKDVGYTFLPMMSSNFQTRHHNTMSIWRDRLSHRRYTLNTQLESAIRKLCVTVGYRSTEI